LIVQYVPDVVPYQDAPPQSGVKAFGSTSSYEVEPSVAFLRRRSAEPVDPVEAEGPGDPEGPEGPEGPGGRPARVEPSGRGEVRVRGPVGLGLPRTPSRPTRTPPIERSTAAIRPDDLVIRGLDGQEARQRRLARGIRVIRLDEPPIRALHLDEGGTAFEAERAIRVVRRHEGRAAPGRLAG
jgi:hypothetical protein